ncbi:MAG: OmpA family protein [Actinomycetia bacterium]|nr:OmpA family protein [Actinomycetes bacterium]
MFLLFPFAVFIRKLINPLIKNKESEKLDLGYGGKGLANDILSRSQKAVAGFEIQDKLLSFSGRDATIEGIVPSEDIKMKIEHAIESERGVRVVHNLLEVTAPESQAEEATVLQNKLDDFIGANNIKFQTNTATIEQTSLPIIDHLAELLGEYPEVQITIGGHTDNQGSEIHNIDLSQERAEAVLSQLVNRSIAADRLSAKGFGSSEPIADNSTAEGCQNNRRVEFKITEVE